MRLVPVLALGAMVLAAGCDELGDTPGYDSLEDRFDAIDDEVGALPLVDPALLPLSGGASYDGVMRLDTSGEGGVPDSMAGDLSLDVDFADDSITGRVDGILTDTDETLDGSLAISNGDIDRDADLETEYTFGFDLSGTLTDEDDDDITVAGKGQGDFFGSGRTHVEGVVDGIATGPDGLADIDGEFVAED